MPRSTTGVKAKMTKKPREILRELRMRTGLSSAEVSRAAGYRNVSGYQRYEKPWKKKSEGDLLPYDFISKIMPVFVGRGTPPVTQDELIAISDAPRVLLSAGTTLASQSTKFSAGEIGAYPQGVQFTASNIGSTPLPIRVRAERGTYMDEDIRSKNFGESQIVASPNFPIEAQFCVSIMDNHAEWLGYPRGTALHCAFPDQFSPAALTDKKIVLWSQREKTGLGEMLVFKYKHAGNSPGSDWLGEDSQGKDVKGRPIGVVVSSVRRE